ncbi:hypothetical protein [Vagococcus fluvialis]|uniref:Uncharacterized protein n=1 Tax=Vagococcus fluvialis TaxID=2738 RepID=A0A369AY70_9ENTE|nr:hypothetical protein [Vagococcus fluvialis]MBO0479209.1 hypothetical protein [Vagococcus fluvialis]MBO0485556.1 hypothetical protein [Vagococcus fluvialis]MDT2745490.1 hypothetical protein [Vagococcus fluvialis]RCX13156.1 hypothetical protein DFR54_107106 [Vagococcus fluvialis]RSU01481.1 hypothetical protein CBF32_08075 [Vagococcus fluvialis]
MKIIIINDVEYAVFAANEGTVKSQPHMIETLSGSVPEGKQLSLLKEYLKQNDIVPIKGATTHWCIDKVLKLGSTKEKTIRKTIHKQKYLPLTEENMEKQHMFVGASSNYGKEGLIIHDVLNAFPLHNDLNTIAMKIAVIDVTNSTHLSQYKSRLSLYDLAKVILEIPNFDDRLAEGDPELVNIIARNIGAVNMFFFASKYCTYHNVEIYGRDDYSIFDGIVKNTLPYYIPGLTVNRIDTWRRNFDYETFNECVGNLLDENNIHIPFRRRKLDHFLWYANR